jgi:predicted amidohydrolase
MKSYSKITVVQKISEKSIPNTLNMMSSLIKMNKDSDIVVFPEMIVESAKAAKKSRIKQIRMQKMEKIYKVEEHLRELSRKYKIDIVFGSMEKLFDKIFNTGVLISNGRIMRYRKVHVHWTEKFEKGKTFKVFDSSCGKIGILICFDSAFPEAARVLALKGAKLIFILSNVPKEFDVEYLNIRNRAIALNNQIYVVHCNKPAPFFNGHSSIIGPRGNIIFEAGSKEAVFTKNIDLREVDRWRDEEKIYKCRLPKLYKDIMTYSQNKSS